MLLRAINAMLRHDQDSNIHEYPVIRHMLNLETVNTHEGSEDVHCPIIGEDIAGYDAFS